MAWGVGLGAWAQGLGLRAWGLGLGAAPGSCVRLGAPVLSSHFKLALGWCRNHDPKKFFGPFLHLEVLLCSPQSTPFMFILVLLVFPHTELEFSRGPWALWGYYRT